MRTVRKSSLLRLVTLTALAACLSAGPASAQGPRGQSRLPGATSAMSAALSHCNYTPPDPCSPLKWVKSLLASLGEFL
jgi:hypothetical protein